jgi:hypothetical protein
LEPDSAAPRRTGIVICPSFFELKAFQRVELHLLRTAAAAGFAGIYVQPPGTADSAGDPLACSLAVRVRTALLAAERLVAKTSANEVLFLGARFGGAVALLAADRADGGVVLWDPALDGDEYWRQTRRFGRVAGALARQRPEDPDVVLARGDVVRSLEQLVSPHLREDLRSIRDVLSLKARPAPALAVCLNDALAARTRRALSPVLPAIQINSLGLPKLRHVVHLRIGDAQGSVESTLDWLGTAVP